VAAVAVAVAVAQAAAGARAEAAARIAKAQPPAQKPGTAERAARLRASALKCLAAINAKGSLILGHVTILGAAQNNRH